MTLMLWIVRILVALIVLRLVMRFIGSVIAGASAKATQTPRKSRQERLGGTLVRDPQCGTYIPQQHALSSGSGEGALYFCSTACRDTWALAHRHKASS